MNSRTISGLVVGSGMALAMIVAAWSPAVAAPATPAVPAPHARMADPKMKDMKMTDAQMTEHCQAMQTRKQALKADMATQDAKLTEQIAVMNRAPDSRKTLLMAAIITDMTAQRIAMDARKSRMEEEMMQHVMQHAQAGGNSMSQCPMMKGMNDMERKQAALPPEHHEGRR